MYLIDSNAWITFLRKPDSPLVARLRSKAVKEVCTCTVVLAELLYGCLKSLKTAANRAKVESVVAPYHCLPFEERAASEFATIRHYLETIGTPIGPPDLQIAAIAMANQCTLVTHNTAEFSRVPGDRI